MTSLIAAAAILLANDCFAPTTDGWEDRKKENTATVRQGGAILIMKKLVPEPGSAVEYFEMELARAKEDAARRKKCAEAIAELEVQVELSRWEKPKWKR